MNRLTGEIPPEFGSLSNLTVLDLSYNDLSGEIPAELGSLSNLTQLWLTENVLTGEIPAWLGSLSNLTHLYLRQNDLSGCIPSSLRDQLGSNVTTDTYRGFCLSDAPSGGGMIVHIVLEGAPERVLAMTHGAAKKRGISLSLPSASRLTAV